MHDLGQIRGLLCGIKRSGNSQVNGAMKIGSNDRGVGLWNHLRQAEKKCDGDYVDYNRRQSHRGEVARSDRFLPEEQVEFGRSFPGDVYARHAFDIETLALRPRLLLGADWKYKPPGENACPNLAANRRVLTG
jgi:hypothetical protein